MTTEKYAVQVGDLEMTSKKMAMKTSIEAEKEALI